MLAGIALARPVAVSQKRTLLRQRPETSFKPAQAV
jgi:hypothetical protein